MRRSWLRDMTALCAPISAGSKEKRGRWWYVSVNRLSKEEEMSGYRTILENFLEMD
jgi:hypothetical protein